MMLWITSIARLAVGWVSSNWLVVIKYAGMAVVGIAILFLMKNQGEEKTARRQLQKELGNVRTRREVEEVIPTLPDDQLDDRLRPPNRRKRM